MAITNFIPEIWSSSLLVNLRDQLVFGQLGVINRNYEGDIAQAGDTVHITSFADPATRPYVRNNPISYDVLSDDTLALVIDQSRYFAFSVDDLDRRQALSGFVAETTLGASYNLAADADDYIAGLMVDGAGNTVDGSGVDEPKEAYELLVALRTSLTRSNTPRPGRWAIVPPEFYALLLQDDRFVRVDASGTSDGLRNGMVRRAAGFDVIESNVAPTDGSAAVIVAGHGIATTYAEQIVDTEALRLETTFGDGIRGLHLYGAKVIRPDNLVIAEVPGLITVES